MSTVINRMSGKKNVAIESEAYLPGCLLDFSAALSQVQTSSISAPPDPTAAAAISSITSYDDSDCRLHIQFSSILRKIVDFCRSFLLGLAANRSGSCFVKFSDDKVDVRWRLAVLFALTLGTTGISAGFNFLSRDFYNALASVYCCGCGFMEDEDQEQFTKQLSYYLASFSGGIPVFVLRDYVKDTLSLRWRSWMTGYYMDRYLKNPTFYKIQPQSIIDNPDQWIVDDLSSFIGTALAFSLTLFNATVDLISFSKILYGIYPPLFLVLLGYSLRGTAISIFIGRGLANLNFLQDKKEADFRYGLVHVRENAESIAFMMVRK
ncbi:Canalicular multispecific organic anion transporter 1 [Orobanche gracilis]